MTDKISAPKFSFMLTVIHNYLISDANSALEWKPDNVEKFRFTNIKQRGAQAGWSQDGLDFYMDKLKEEINFRKEMNKKFNNVEERSDFFYYIEENKMEGEDEQVGSNSLEIHCNQEEFEFDSESDNENNDDSSETQLNQEQNISDKCYEREIIRKFYVIMIS